MKTKFLFVALFLSLFVINSCQKSQNTNETDVVNETYDITQKKIVSFIDKMNNKDIKSYDDYSVDSAVWYIEAALNYTYCINSKTERYLNKNIDTMYISLTQKNETIPFSKVVDVYCSIEKRVKNENAKIYYDNVDYVDVEFENDELIAYIHLETDTDLEGLDFDENGYYVIDQYWQWGHKQGLCYYDYWDGGRDVTDEMYLWIQYQDDPIDDATLVKPAYWTDIHVTKWYIDDGYKITSEIPGGGEFKTITWGGNMFFKDVTGYLDDYGDYDECIFPAYATQLAIKSRGIRDYISNNLLPESYYLCKDIEISSFIMGIVDKRYAYHMMRIIYGIPHAQAL